MKLTIIGTGYVGLVSGVCFAELGNTVVCVDKLETKVQQLQAGKSPIYEPGLEELLQKNIQSGNLSFTTDLKENIQDSDIIIIAVGTPQSEDGSADLTYVHQVAKEIGEALPTNSRFVIVNKSTVPVGTAQSVKTIILEQNADVDIAVCSVPEFLREGSAVYDTMNPDRIVIGSSSQWATDLLETIHFPLASGDKIVRTDEPSAEMIKYAANSFLATKISFINEMANISEHLGANIDDVVRGIGSDRRISLIFLNAGLGYGGSCFPKDVRALMNMAGARDYVPVMLQAADEVNVRQRHRPIQHLDTHFNEELEGKTVAVLGLAFKPNTDDMRDAPSIDIIHDLTKRGAHIRAHDPIASEAAAPLLPRSVHLATSAQDAYTGADAVIIVTEWDEYKALTPAQLTAHMQGNVLIDGRNALDFAAYKDAGFDYYGIGRS
ncbi:LOW QUALITY PROTEIN: UDP-glucose dehydrogenase [Geomicrobium sp. JCM 19039]|nr:LOW QUALITY PROTEIN: UDP-glucose dehydrogenase [Geomicrobium sp. JCM 19039]